MKQSLQKLLQARSAQRTARTRSRLQGTPSRPRMAVHKTLAHMSVQLIDDTNGKTLVAAHDREVKAKGTKTQVAAAVGTLIAQKAKEKKIAAVVFDRRGNKYHGRLKALADAAREGGLQF